MDMRRNQVLDLCEWDWDWDGLFFFFVSFVRSFVEVEQRHVEKEASRVASLSAEDRLLLSTSTQDEEDVVSLTRPMEDHADAALSISHDVLRSNAKFKSKFSRCIVLCSV